MGQKFCSSCGAALSDGVNFCENCGTSVAHDESLASPPAPPVTDGLAPPPKESAGLTVSGAKSTQKVPVILLVAIVIMIVIAAAAFVFVLPKISGSTGPVIGQKSTTVAVTQTTVIAVTTFTPIPTQNPFPNALALRQKFSFGSGNIAGVGTVYWYWMNDTYQWHNDKDNQYYVEKPPAGYKFLAIFVGVTNTGNNPIWPPMADNIHLIYDGNEYTLDQDHYLPDKSINIKATPIEIQEIQYVSKLTGSEYVEDYGYSHGTKYAYLYPGESNAIDGYLIYEVPASLTPDKTFVKIDFNGQDAGVWKLA